MTSSTATVPGEGRDKKTVDKVLYRMKSVFRKGSSTRSSRPSVMPVQTPVLYSQTVAPPAQVKEMPEYEGATRIPRIQVHEERAKKLGSRFGLEIKPNEWHTTEGDVLRVDRAVRMRIHQECHLCHSRFGTGNVCPACQHARCSQCTRHPPWRNEAERQANREKREALIQQRKENAPIIPSYDFSPAPIIYKRPRKAQSQDLVFKGRPRMRVRRYCHVCQSLIGAHTKVPRTCDGCGHQRCADCPRQPNDKKSYPYGYPNDEPGSTFKGVYACHECKTKFDPQQTGEDVVVRCSKCSHARCSECPRVRPRRVEPEPDPDIMAQLRLRMQEMQTSES
ncbi:hypothetical protein F5Y17DRAFT_35245 [Xylariaceae sp. FL0594]|nr:hypothetical protein F5Y17DRAFT_35245 [Xylariaceae sp. FL0594]